MIKQINKQTYRSFFSFCFSLSDFEDFGGPDDCPPPLTAAFITNLTNLTSKDHEQVESCLNKFELDWTGWILIISCCNKRAGKAAATVRQEGMDWSLNFLAKTTFVIFCFFENFLIFLILTSLLLQILASHGLSQSEIWPLAASNSFKKLQQLLRLLRSLRSSPLPPLPSTAVLDFCAVSKLHRLQTQDRVVSRLFWL